jgi:hypothetical protein
MRVLVCLRSFQVLKQPILTQMDVNIVPLEINQVKWGTLDLVGVKVT